MRHVRPKVRTRSDSASLGEEVAGRVRDPARREVLKTGAGIAVSLAAGASAMLAGCGSGGGDGGAPAPMPPSGTPGTVSGRPASLGFSAVPKGLDDRVVVPAGYTATVLLRAGDPLVSSISEYRNDGTDTAASFQSRFGDGADGVQFFRLGANGRFSASVSDRALIAVNHELLSENFLHPTGPTVVGGVRTVPSEVQKEYRALGVSIVEIARSGNTWTYRKDSTFGRRIDAVTDMTIAGPAGSSPYMVTKYSPDGSGLWVCEYDAAAVAKLDRRLGRVSRRIELGLKPYDVKLDPLRQRLVITDYGLNKVHLLDLASGTTLATLPALEKPTCVALTPGVTNALVANSQPAGDARALDYGAQVSVINLTTFAVSQIRLPAGSTSVQGLTVSPDGRWAYATHLLGRTYLPTTQLNGGWIINNVVSIIDLAAGQVYATVPLDAFEEGAANPWGLAISTNAQCLWVCGSGVHEIIRLDLPALHTYLNTNSQVRAHLDSDLITL